MTEQDGDVVERLKTVTGSGCLYMTPARENRKPIYTWLVSNRREVARILLAIAPLMGERRKARILEAAEVISKERHRLGAKLAW